MRRCIVWVWGVALVAGSFAAGHSQESGYQIINGTRVFTQIDHASDTATFSNECGSLTISHRDLGNGAIPDRIIPCPRPKAPTGPRPSSGNPFANQDQADHHAFLPGQAPKCYAEAK